MAVDLAYPEIKFYARPRGSHVHASLNCPLLVGGQFNYYKYDCIKLSEAIERKLEPCACVYDRLGSHHRFKGIKQVRNYLKRTGWRETDDLLL